MIVQHNLVILTCFPGNAHPLSKTIILCLFSPYISHIPSPFQILLIPLLNLQLKKFKKKNRITVRSRNPSSGYTSKRIENEVSKACLHIPFTAALFTVAGRLEQPNYPPKGEWIKQSVVFPYNEILFRLKKE